MQRQIVLDAINELANHPTAEDIYVHITKKHPTISKATVYRNLATAAEAGEVLSVGIFDGAMHYDHYNEDHFHFVCDKCNKLIDIPSFDLKDQLNPLSGLDINKIELTLRGLCKACQ